MAEGGAQVIVTQICEVCDSQDNVNWLCVDCDQKLCDRCKAGHLRGKKTKNDTVVTLKQGRDESRTRMPVLTCDQHSTLCDVYCYKCDKVICLECLESNHQSHDWKMVKKVLPSIKKEIQDLNASLATKLDLFEKGLEGQGQVHSAFVNGIDDIKEKVNGNMDKNIEKLNKCRKNQLEQLSNLQKQETKRYADICNSFEQQTRTIRGLMETFEGEKENIFCLIQLRREMQQILSNTTDTTTPKVTLPVFKFGSLNENMLSHLDTSKAGVSIECIDRHTNTNVDTQSASGTQENFASPPRPATQRLNPNTFVVKKTLQVPGVTRTVRTICPDQQGGVWLAMDCDSYLTHIDKDGNQTERSVGLSGQILDVVMNSSEELFVICDNQSLVKKLPPKADKISVFAKLDSFSFMITSLCIADNDDIIIGFYDKTASRYQKCVIQSYDATGQVNMTFECATYFGSMGAILNMSCLSQKEIVAIFCYLTNVKYIEMYCNQTSSAPIWHENEQSWLKSRENFSPCSITHDVHNNLYIADDTVNELYIINKNGTGIQCLRGVERGIKDQPKCLIVDKDGRLWIGCAHGKIYILDSVNI